MLVFVSVRAAFSSEELSSMFYLQIKIFTYSEFEVSTQNDFVSIHAEHIKHFKHYRNCYIKT